MTVKHRNQISGLQFSVWLDRFPIDDVNRRIGQANETEYFGFAPRYLRFLGATADTLPLDPLGFWWPVRYVLQFGVEASPLPENVVTFEFNEVLPGPDGLPRNPLIRTEHRMPWADRYTFLREVHLGPHPDDLGLWPCHVGVSCDVETGEAVVGVHYGEPRLMGSPAYA